MPISKVMKFIFSIFLLFVSFELFASAPLESGFALAPRSTASQEEKARAYTEARKRVIDAARKYEGTPYVYGGMSSRGLDCSGFICLSYRDALGVSLPRSAAGLYSWVEKIPFERAQPGDLLFFRTGNNRNITHVALYLGNRRFIHSASAGAKTGVIYSSLDEQYWSRAFAGAGRAFPEASSGFTNEENFSLTDMGSNPAMQGGRQNSSGSQGNPANPGRSNSSSNSNNTRLLVGAAFAPNFYFMGSGGEVFRGFTSQLCFITETSFFGPQVSFGLELRPEYNGALEVFRLPITFSFQANKYLWIFAGPAICFGEAAISINDDVRPYTGGTSWFGTIGMTIEPVKINIKNSDVAPYVEIAWQSYHTEDLSFNLAADFSASFRFSTGVKWRMQVY